MFVNFSERRAEYIASLEGENDVVVVGTSELGGVDTRDDDTKSVSSVGKQALETSQFDAVNIDSKG